MTTAVLPFGPFNFYKTRTTSRLPVLSLQIKPSPLELDLKATIQNMILPTKRGIAAIDESKKQQIDSLIQELEDQCPLKQPARSPWMDGRWIVEYSTAPPPSNGQLGPFVGIARQYIDLKSKSYINHLSVPGNLKDEWLSAILSAAFEEWDGVPITDSTAHLKKSSSMFPINTTTRHDYGASNWKVNFKKLSIRVFGLIIFEKQFQVETARVWKMTYLDEDTRVGMCLTFDSDICLRFIAHHLFMPVFDSSCREDRAERRRRSFLYD
jgi:hypothetical protein